MRRLALPVLVAALVLGAGSPAVADEVVDRPADGAFSLSGHGWGHGRGMSQWGAQNAAKLGRTADEITATYYPGTTRTVLAPAPIRVWLQGDEGVDLQVSPAPGLTVTDVSTGISTALPPDAARYRVLVTSAGLHAQRLDGTTWSPVLIGGGSAHGGPLRFSGGGLNRVHFPDGTSREYRGVVQAVRTGTATMQSVVVLPLEEYLLGVVPREAPASWEPAALQAQAIAARSYSANKRERVNGGGHYDVCDTTSCQVFGGTRLHSSRGTTELEHPATTAAVVATSGVVRTYQGRSIFAEFSSSNGGWSTKGDFPYLVAREDPWDGAFPTPVHSWTARLPVADLERAYPAVGRLQRLRITARDGNGEWGGRILTVVLEGTSSSGAVTRVATTGAALRAVRPWPTASDGLRSTWWQVTGAVEAGPPRTSTFKGSGPRRLGRR